MTAPALRHLRHHFKGTEQGVAFRVPAWHWAWRGAVLPLALPPLFTVLEVLLSVGEDGVSAPSVVIAGLGGFSFVAGLTLAMLSPLLSARTRTALDFADATFTSARLPHPVPVAQISSIALAQTSTLSSFIEIRALRSGQRPVRILGPLMPKHAGEAAELADFLARRLNVPVDLGRQAAPAGDTGGSDRLAGALCYLPIQGVFILASLYYLFAAKQRPFVRFCAIQSSSQFVFSILVLGVVLIALGVPVAMTGPSPAQTALIVLLALALTGFWLWNLATHVFACWSAYKGRLWVMPWLGFWVRRFLPDDS